MPHNLIASIPRVLSLLISLKIGSQAASIQSPSAEAPVTDSMMEAPDSVTRDSDTYVLSAYVWRDAMPLVITGVQLSKHNKVMQLLLNCYEPRDICCFLPSLPSIAWSIAAIVLQGLLLCQVQ